MTVDTKKNTQVWLITGSSRGLGARSPRRSSRQAIAWLRPHATRSSSRSSSSDTGTEHAPSPST